MDGMASAQPRSIINDLSKADRLAISALSRDGVILLHHGLGAGIRNRMRAGELAALTGWARDELEPGSKSLDDLSWPILASVWAATQPQSTS